jgi:hypothetical protein
MIGGSANKVVVPTLTRSYVLYAREDRKQTLLRTSSRSTLIIPIATSHVARDHQGSLASSQGRKRNGVHSECGDGPASRIRASNLS